LIAIIDITLSIRNTLINVVGIFGCPRVCYHWVYGDLYGIFHVIKNPHHCVVRVVLLGVEYSRFAIDQLHHFKSLRCCSTHG